MRITIVLRFKFEFKMTTKALNFEVAKKCTTTRARCGKLTLQSNGFEPVVVDTPVFMPVGTSGTMKGILPEQLVATGCRLMLSNTYHLGSRPGADVIDKAGGLHSFMNWPHALLTDSGGFQMVSLSKLTTITEQGAEFTSPYNPDQMLNLTPEEATQIQHKIGANIIMQLDDVVHSCTEDQNRVEEAMHRSIRWYDRCKETHQSREDKQNLFPIIQGGLNAELRRYCASEIVKRDSPGIAVGGLSGGEAKDKFIEMVAVSTESLPDGKPRYLMGVGIALDMLMSVAMGIDMFDCVYPTRTARFGCALIGYGKQISLKQKFYEKDFNPICNECDCSTCKKPYSRAYLSFLVRRRATVGCHLLTQHNIRFQMRFMEKIRQAIKNETFREFLFENLSYHFNTKEDYPEWITKALKILNLDS